VSRKLNFGKKSGMFSMKHKSASALMNRTSFKSEEKWNPAVTTVTEDEDIITTKTTQTGERVTPASRAVEDPSGGDKWRSDMCAEAAAAGMDCDDYIIKKEADLGYTEKVEPLERENIDVEKKPKKCTCTAQQEYYGVHMGQELEYPCDGEKPAGCSPKEDPGPEPRKCSCTNPENNQTVTYPCGSEKPAECFKGGCPPKDCKKNEFWSPRECICKKRVKTKKKKKKFKTICRDIFNRRTGTWENKCVKGDSTSIFNPKNW
jgi:hypothetical protein